MVCSVVMEMMERMEWGMRDTLHKPSCNLKAMALTNLRMASLEASTPAG